MKRLAVELLEDAIFLLLCLAVYVLVMSVGCGGRWCEF